MIDKNLLLDAKTQEEVIKKLKEIRYYPEVKEIQGDKYAIVVIPTKDINGEYAKTDLEIFKGLHIIFVANKIGIFNYAQAVNRGSDFNIGNYIGKSLGTGTDRIFWELANEIYFESVK